MLKNDAIREGGFFVSRKDAKAQKETQLRYSQIGSCSSLLSKLQIFHTKARRHEGTKERQLSSWLPGFLIHPLCVFAPLREILLLIPVLLLFCTTAFAAAPVEFNAANGLYDKGDFQGARAAYEALVQSGHRSANLFYDLGNAAFRQGDKGAAFLAYERALALEPSHPEAKANLNFLRNETGAKLPTVPWYGRALSWPVANEAAWVAAVAFWGFCFSLAPLFWKKRPATALATFCALALIWSSAVVGWHASRGEIWIVTADNAQIRATPAENSPSTTLPMGSQVRMLLERGPWLCVQLPDDAKVWLARETVQPVRMK